MNQKTRKKVRDLGHRLIPRSVEQDVEPTVHGLSIIRNIPSDAEYCADCQARTDIAHGDRADPGMDQLLKPCRGTSKQTSSEPVPQAPTLTSHSLRQELASMRGKVMEGVMLPTDTPVPSKRLGKPQHHWSVRWKGGKPYTIVDGCKHWG